MPLGSIKLQLNVDGTVIAPPGGFVAADIPVVFQFDKNGALIQPAKIWSNEELNPQLSSTLLGTYYLVTFYDQNGAILNNTPMWWQFPESNGATVDISQMTPLSVVGGNIIYYPTSFIGGSGTVTSVAFVGDGIILSATPSTPVTVAGNLIATLLTQNANTVLAGPATGSATAPTFRALVSADLPAGISTWSSLQPAATNLTLANAGFSTTFNQTSAVNWAWANTTSATNSVPQSTPVLNLKGEYWTGSASAPDGWSIQGVIGTGANPQSILTLSHSGTSGSTSVSLPGSGLTVGFTLSAATVNGGVGIFQFNPLGNGSVLTLTSAATAIGALTTYNFSAATSGVFIGSYVTIAGFSTGANNGRYIVQAFSGGTSGTVTVYNSGGVAETHAATATADQPYISNSGGFDTGFGNAGVNSYSVKGTAYTPTATFETISPNPIVLTAKGNATDSEYLRIISDGATGNHGLEIGAIIDGTGLAPVTLQMGNFLGGSAAVFNVPVTVKGAALTGSTSQLSFGSTTATSASAGSNGDVPAQVVGYLIFDLAGTKIKVPYYAV